MASGNLTCAALTDSDIPNSITIDLATAATALQANPTDCSANQFATAIAANGNLTCAALTDADIPDSITVTLANTATALAANPSDCAANTFATTIAASGNLTCASIAANNLPTAAADLGAADVTINLGNTNGSFVTNLITDGTITAATFNGNLIGDVTGNATTASALAVNPADCGANTFAHTIAASGNLTCSTVGKTALANSGTLGFTWSDAEVSDTLTASLFVGSGSTTNAIDLATAEVAGTLPVANGGTGASTFTSNGVLFGNTTGAVQATTAGTSGQILLANGSGVPTFTTVSSDITISNTGVATIQANSVALATDTTGNYVATVAIAAGGGLEVSGVGGENATATISVRSDCGNNQIIKWSTGSGGVWNCANDGVSDVRAKNNIKTLESDILDKLRDVRSVTFDYSCESPIFNNLHCDTNHKTGVIAQELAKIFPELVHLEADKYYWVDYDALNVYTLRAVSELAKYINSSGAANFKSIVVEGVIEADTIRVANLEGLDYEDRLDDLDSRVGALEAGNGQGVDLDSLEVGALQVSLDLLVNGGITINGNAVFNGTALFDQLVTFNNDVHFGGDLQVLGTATFNNSAGGYAVIKAGQQIVHINFPTPYDQAPVINVNLGGGLFEQFSYNNVTSTGFDIVVAHPAVQNLNFSWSATAVASPLTFVQP